MNERLQRIRELCPVAYISGPMSGIPEFNFPAFNKFAEELRANEFKVFNPAENDRGSTDKSWEYYMSLDIPNVVSSDCAFVLPGWEASRGANIELCIAAILKKPIFLADTLEELEFSPIFIGMPGDPKLAEMLFMIISLIVKLIGLAR